MQSKILKTHIFLPQQNALEHKGLTRMNCLRTQNLIIRDDRSMVEQYANCSPVKKTPSEDNCLRKMSFCTKAERKRGKENQLSC